jgi:hypothetical protein
MTAGDVPDAGAASSSDRTKSIQGIVGAVVAGFAAVLSFIGVKSTEISDILRNQEPVIGIVSFAFLLSILAAVFAVLERDPHAGKWPTKGFTIVTLLLIASVGPILTVVIQIPLVTTPLQARFGATAGSVMIAIAVVLLVIGWRPLTDAERDQAAAARGLGRWYRRARVWTRGDFDRQRYFVLASILLLAVAAYSALRIESASQSTPFAQLTAKLTVSGPGPGMDVLSVSAASQKVPVADRVQITVRGLPRGASISAICQGQPSPGPDMFPCSVDPCRFMYCKTLVGWMLPPDGTGSVSETLVLPFSAQLYQRLEVIDLLCEPTRVQGLCVQQSSVGTNLEIQVAAPAAPVISRSRPSRH